MLESSKRINTPDFHEQHQTRKDSTPNTYRNKVSYFHPDIHSKIVERAKKENLIEEQLPSEYPSRKATVADSKVDHLGKAGKIMEDLIKKHGLAKEKISKLKEEARQSEKQTQCALKPLPAGGEKFIFRGSMIQRNQVWLQEKKRKQIERKEEALVTDLQQCTFSPQISSRKMSQIYLKNKSKLPHEQIHKEHSRPMQTPSPLRNKKDISLTQFQSAKKEIKSRLFTIALRN